jgi:membrane protease YdiL (CAAX protease family)
MKVKFVRFFSFLLVTVMLFMIAARPLQETPGDWLGALVTFFLSLAGFAAFIAFVVNIAKRFGWVDDGQADMLAKYLNLFGLVVVGILQIVVPGAIAPVDTILGLLAQLGGVLFPILALLFGWPVANAVSSFTHNRVRGVPLIGYSYSRAKG